MKRRRRWLIVAGIVVALSIGLAVALRRAMPVDAARTANAVVLTSRSDTTWTARVSVGPEHHRVDVPPRGTVTVAIEDFGARGSPWMMVELYRPGAESPGWTLTRSKPSVKAGRDGFEADAGVKVQGTLSEMLGLAGRR